LKTVREIKKREVENYFFNTNKEISLFAQSQVVIEAMKSFKKSFHSITKRNLPDGYSDTLKQYYQKKFRKKVNTPDASAIDFSSLVPTNPISVLLQVEYLGGNRPLLKPLPFNKVHDQYHSFFSEFIKTTGYYDLLLVDDETGYVVYSVDKEVDFATNLLDGPYANTNMGNLFKKLRSSNSGKQATMCDFERYLPSYLSPASFIATPVFDGNKKIGTLIFQIPIDKLDAITINKKTWEEEGLGETGECYVVGKDCKLRTNSRFIIEEPQEFFNMMEKNSYDKAQIDLMKYYKTTILFQAKCNDAISKSGNDQTGLTITKDYRGVEVLSAYTQLDIPGVSWFIVAEMDVSEVFSSVYLYRLNSLIFVGAVFIILIVVAFSIARSIYKPINMLVEGAKELGKGNLNIQLDIKNKDEFGLLANAFNRGVSALKNNRNEILENALDTERKLNEELTQREEELTSSEEELRQSLESQSILLDEIQLKKVSLAALINNTNDLIYSLDKNLLLVEFNNSVWDFYSKRGVELLKGKHVNDFIPKKNIEEATRAFKKVLQGHSEMALIEIADLNGNIQFFEASHNPIRNEKKDVIGVSVMIREVTERIKVLQALQASEEKFAKAFKSSPDSVLITAVKDSRIVELNEGFLSWSGYTREEVEGRTTMDLGFWDQEERNNLKKILTEEGRVRELEVQLKIKSGEIRDCILSAETIELEGELCLVSITRDITI
ncbi:MAG TPA: PAS domain S-box protein, partial [Cytophagaceae bacterium]|nr:PAS domain S-box protein [Cytophagaceae bacterium]